MSDTGVGGESQVAGTRIDTLNGFVVITAAVSALGGFLFGLDTITLTGLFWFYGVFAALGTIFVIRRVPETKGKSLEVVSKELAERAS